MEHREININVFHLHYTDEYKDSCYFIDKEKNFNVVTHIHSMLATEQQPQVFINTNQTLWVGLVSSSHGNSWVKMAFKTSSHFLNLNTRFLTRDHTIVLLFIHKSTKFRLQRKARTLVKDAPEHQFLLVFDWETKSDYWLLIKVQCVCVKVMESLYDTVTLH